MASPRSPCCPRKENTGGGDMKLPLPGYGVPSMWGFPFVGPPYSLRQDMADVAEKDRQLYLIYGGEDVVAAFPFAVYKKWPRAKFAAHVRAKMQADMQHRALP